MKKPIPAQTTPRETISQFLLRRLTVQQQWALLEAIARTQLYRISIRQSLHECATDYLFPPTIPVVEGILDFIPTTEEAAIACGHIVLSLQRAANDREAA